MAPAGADRVSDLLVSTRPWRSVRPGGMVLARYVRVHPAAAGLASLREPRRGFSVRPVERAAPADGSGVPPGGVRHALWRGASVPLGHRTAGSVARELRFLHVGGRARRL